MDLKLYLITIGMFLLIGMFFILLVIRMFRNSNTEYKYLFYHLYKNMLEDGVTKESVCKEMGENGWRLHMIDDTDSTKITLIFIKTLSRTNLF